MHQRPLSLFATLLLPAMAVLTTPSLSQTPKPIHISGPKAMQLISLLVSGSGAVRSRLQNGGTDLVLHDLVVTSEATQKYDPDSAYYMLAITSASARVGEAKDSSPMGESAALFAFFSGPMKAYADSSMGGSSFSWESVSCKVVTTAAQASASRYQCALVPAG